MSDNDPALWGDPNTLVPLHQVATAFRCLVRCPFLVPFYPQLPVHRGFAEGNAAGAPGRAGRTGRLQRRFAHPAAAAPPGKFTPSRRAPGMGRGGYNDRTAYLDGSSSTLLAHQHYNAINFAKPERSAVHLHSLHRCPPPTCGHARHMRPAAPKR